jgi:hypothetical protein
VGDCAPIVDAPRLQGALTALARELVPNADEAAGLAELLSAPFRDRGVWIHAAADNVLLLAVATTALLHLLPGIPRELVAERIGDAGGFFVRIRPCLRHRGP